MSKIDIDDYHAISESIAESIALCGKPLTENQQIMMAGAIGVWLNRMRLHAQEEFKKEINQKFRSSIDSMQRMMSGEGLRNPLDEAKS